MISFAEFNGTSAMEKGSEVVGRLPHSKHSWTNDDLISEIFRSGNGEINFWWTPQGCLQILWPLEWPAELSIMLANETIVTPSGLTPKQSNKWWTVAAFRGIFQAFGTGDDAERWLRRVEGATITIDDRCLSRQWGARIALRHLVGGSLSVNWWYYTLYIQRFGVRT